MCGIAGIINYNNSEDDMQGLLCRMIGLLRHRGPDASGIFMKGPAGLGHARLSIIDLNSGDQPVYNEDRTVWVVFNGEIFNYPELRKDLESRGHRFYTQTDTEVLVHLYEERGPDLCHDLNGQFAFALWDQKQETLLLARDRLGIRPLFFIIIKKRQRMNVSISFFRDIMPYFLEKVCQSVNIGNWHFMTLIPGNGLCQSGLRN